MATRKAWLAGLLTIVAALVPTSAWGRPPDPVTAHATRLLACTMVGTQGNDTLVGTPGRDVICARGGDDVVRGRGGDDVIYGGRGNDRLDGGAGADRLYGYSGADRLSGRSGDDFLQGGADADVLSGGSGADIADYSTRHGSLRVTIGRRADDGFAGEGDDVRGDVEAVRTGSGDDKLIGNGRANRLFGGAGRDVLKGGRGNDLLSGGPGKDRLDGGRGADTIDCGGRGDRVRADARDHVRPDCHRKKSPPHTPTRIRLSSTSVAEDQPAGTLVGTLSATGRGRPLRFTLAGGADDGSFRIDGNRLLTNAVFDFEAKSAYAIRIRATPRHGRSFAQAFAITIADRNDAPAADAKTVARLSEDGMKAIALSGSDPDGNALTFHAAQPQHGRLDTTAPAASCDGARPSHCTATVVYMPAADYNGPDSFAYSVHDGTSDSAAAAVTATVDPVDDAPVAHDGDVAVDEGTATAVDLGGLVSDVETSDANLTYTIVSQPGHGTLTGSGGTRTYTPNPGFNGSDGFTYTVADRGDPDNCSGPAPACDAPKTSATKTVSLAVAPVNDVPVAADATENVNEDGQVAVDVQALVSDSETSDANLTYAIAEHPAHGTLSGSDGNLTYTPDADYNGPDSFTYAVTDRGDPDNCGTPGPGCAAPKTSSGTVTISVAPVNDAPVADDRSLSTDEDTPATVDLGALVSDVETSNAELTYTIVSQPAHGTLDGTGASPQYTPDQDFNGSDSFTYKVTDRGDPDDCSGGPPACDAPLSSTTRTVALTVDPVNDVPAAPAKNLSVDEDHALPIDLTALVSDSETSDANLTFAIVGDPAHGTLSGSGASWTYTPAADFNGTDAVVYTVTDRGDPDNCMAGSGCAAPETTTGTIAITVDPVNDAPVAHDGTAMLDEDQATAVDLGALVSDVETSDADLDYTIVGQPAHGTLSGAGASPQYTPDQDFNGSDSFTYKVTDRGDPDGCSGAAPECDAPLSSTTQTVSLTVNPVNDVPMAAPASLSVDEDHALPIDLSALASDVETSDANLTYTIVSGPTHGTLTGAGGSRTYTPDADYNGADSLTYRVTDRGDPDNCGAVGPGCTAPEASSDATIDIAIAAVDDAPVNTVPAGPVKAVQDTDTPIHGVSIADVDANGQPVQVTLSAQHGTIALSTSVVPFGVAPGDVDTVSMPGSVIVTAPIAAINTTFADPNGLVYHGDAAYTGPDTLTVTTDDLGHNGSGGPLSDTDTVALTVLPPNQAPVASAQSVTTAEDTAKAITLSASDADGDALTLSIATPPQHGSLGSLGAPACGGGTPNTCTASVTYTPDPDYNGDDSFTFTANDGRDDSAAATISLTVTPVNDAPQLAGTEAGTLAYTENDPATAVTATTTVSDVDSADFDGGTLTVDFSAGGTVDDRLEIGSIGQIAVSGSNVTFAGTTIGSFAGGSGTTALSVTLNPDADAATTQALVRAITYRNVSDSPATAARTVRFVLTDGDGGTSAAATRGIAVTAVDDPPVLAGIEAGALSYVESVDSAAGQSQITSTLTAGDVDNANLAGATVQITGACTPGEDVLVFTAQNGISGTYTAAGCRLVLTGSSSVANYQTALRSVKYEDTSDTPDTTTRTVAFTVDDGTADSNTPTRDITVTAANDSPTGGADTFNGANSALAGVTLAVSTSPSTPNVAVTGSLLANDTDPDTPHPSLTATAGTSSDQGGVVAVNADGTFSYTPAPGFSGTDTFTYTVHDNDATAPRTDTAVVTINVAGPRVWFVNPGGSAGNGTSASPLSSLAPLSTAGDPDGAGDVIFVYQGTGNATAGGFALEANQRLVGEPQGLSVTNANGTYNLVTAGGDNPTITNTSGAGLTLADGDTIQRIDVKNASGAGVTGSAIGTLTYGANSTISGNGGGGLTLSGAAGGAISVAADISTSAGHSVSIANRTSGTTSLSGAISDTGTGISLSANAGATVSFTGTLNASTGANDAFTATGGGTINVNTGATRALTTTSGTALALTGVGGAISLTDLDKNGAGTGISLSAAGASVTIPSGATIANTTTAGVTIDQGTGAFSYAGTIANSSGRAVQVTNRNTGSPGLVQFTGSIASTGGTGVNLDNNDNGTIAFSGGLVLSTGASTAFSATNGGVVNVDNTGVTNTLTTTTGTALNVADTTIGSTGLKFQSISAGTPASGPASGIVLNNTGSSGGLTVTGDSGSAKNGSGGTIQKTSGNGIGLTSTRGASFDQMNIQDTGGSGVRGFTAVQDFTFTNSTINNSGTGGGNQESSIAFNDPSGSATDAKVTGTVTITGNTLTNALWHGVSILQFAGALSDVNISSNTLTSGTTTGTGGSSLGSGIQLFAGGTAATAATVTRAELNNNTITNFPGGVLIAVECGTSNASGPTADCGTPGSATNDIEIKGNILNGGGTTPDGAGGVILPNQLMLLTENGRGQGQFTVQNNGTVADPLSGSAGNGIDISAGGAVTAQATVTGNQIDAAGQTVSGTSGIAAGVGPFTVTGPTTLSTATLYATVQNNSVRNSAGSGIRLNVNAGSPTLNGILTGNTVTAPISATYGMQVVEGNNAGFTGHANVQISGNTSTGGTGGGNTFPGIGLRKFGTATSEFSIVGLTPSPATNAQMESYVAGANPGSASGTFGTGGAAAINGSSGNWTSIASVPQPPSLP